MATSHTMPNVLELGSSSRRPVLLAERFRIDRPDGDRHEATDTRNGGTVMVTRVVFGADRREERELFLQRVRKLWTVTSPGLVLPIDAGPWDDDAFLAEERVEAPSTTIAAGIEKLDAAERASAARVVGEAIATLHAAGFVHGDLSMDTIDLDGYRQPKIHAAAVAVRSSTESERSEDHELRAILDEISPGVVDSARVNATAAELVRSMRVVRPSTSTPLVPGARAPASRAWAIGAVLFGVIAIVLWMVLAR